MNFFCLSWAVSMFLPSWESLAGEMIAPKYILKQWLGIDGFDGVFLAEVMEQGQRLVAI